MNTCDRSLVSTAAVVAVLSMSTTLRAQPTQPAVARVPATLALVNSLRIPTAPAMILRRSSVEPRDVILLPKSNARQEVLAAALATLQSVRSVLGDTARTDMVIGVRNSAVRRQRSAADLRQAAGILLQLEKAAPRDVAQVGHVRAVDIHLRRSAHAPSQQPGVARRLR